jgi:hypothetical protein
MLHFAMLVQLFFVFWGFFCFVLFCFVFSVKVIVKFIKKGTNFHRLQAGHL